MILKEKIKNGIKSVLMRTTPKIKYSTDPNVLNAIVAYNTYGGYCIPSSSMYRIAAQMVLKGEVYEPDTIRFIAENCRKGDVVHAGTFFGDFLPGISKGLSDSAKIWAFEPNPESFWAASITIRLNSINNVELFNYGLSEWNQSGFVKVKDINGKSLGGTSSIQMESTNDFTTRPINLVSLDEIIPNDRSLSIIQLDVEGHEVKALKGAMNLISREKPILILESISDKKWFEEAIITMGYRYIGKLHDNTVWSID